MAIKKYTNGSWVSASYRKYGTETDAITTLPATIIGDGTPISSYTIKGNTEQTGTPTPENPIMPSECGDRTENLFSGEFSQFSNIGGTGNLYTYFYISEDFTLTLIAKDTHTVPSNVFLGITKDGGQADGGYTWAIQKSTYATEGTVFTVKSSTDGYHYVSMYQKTTSVLNWILEHYYIMLNLGSTALPYEPYGYKLPITLGNTTTNIYLGEVQSTRRIKKLVLTGKEEWFFYANQNESVWQFYTSDFINGLTNSSIMSNIAEYGATEDTRDFYDYSGYLVRSGRGISFQMRGAKDTFVDVAAWKSFLAQQYAAGTPVTIWYILAEPETGIVNEPIRKIGGYVDSVSGTNLATSGTAQQFDVGTTLKPSEVDLTYHGWHKHDDTKHST